MKLHAGLLLAAFAWSGAGAQMPGPPGTSTYRDHYIDGGSLTPDVSAGDGSSDDSDGLARSLQVDGIASALSSHGGGSSSNDREEGISAKSQWETASYGAWSLDASWRPGASDQGPAEQGQGGVVTLRERGMPFDGGWQADGGLGDLNSPVIDLVRLQPRFYLPTSPVQGVATEWRGPSGLEVVAGAGVPGLYDGIVVPNFRTLAGTTATVGAQWSPTSQWSIGTQFIGARGVDLAVGPVIEGSDAMASNAALLSAAWRSGGERLQFNLLDGDVDGRNDLGAWVDGSIAAGSWLQNAGLFRIDPDMTWGNQLISNDMQGGYYRLDYQSRRWQADAGIDEVHSVAGAGSDTTFLTGDGRCQLSRDWGAGSVITASHAEGATGWSLEGYVDHANAQGTGRLQADVADTAAGRDATFALNQSWSAPVGMRLSTAASVERISGAVINGREQNSTILGLSAYGAGQLTSDFGIDGNVHWAAAVDGRAAPGMFANVSLRWRLSAALELLATYYDSRVGSWTPLTVVSPLSPPVAAPVGAMQERGVFLTIRYRRAAGTPFAPLGGGAGGAAGEIAGSVFLDANANGQPDAGEPGAPNVTVLLDGRFSVQTDAAGRFAFPMVATGRHVITVIPDNLPLPWILEGGATSIEVTTRERTLVNLGALRPR